MPPPHLLTTAQLNGAQLRRLVLGAIQHKQATFPLQHRPLVGASAALLFSKRSTRTRVAAEAALAHLGVHPLFLASQDIQLGENESLKDTMRVLSRLCSAVIARVHSHDILQDMAQHSSVPILNALSDSYHPTQLVADVLTMHEHRAQSLPSALPHDTLAGVKVAWVGDGNNILHELMVGLPPLGIHLAYATPSTYLPDPRIVALGEQRARQYHTELYHSTHPKDVVQHADFILTDTWISMGQESEKQARIHAFQGYQVTRELCDQYAKPSWRFMHCLPRKQEEVTDDVFYDDQRSLVWQEAENRKWSMLAILQAMLVDKAFLE